MGSAPELSSLHLPSDTPEWLESCLRYTRWANNAVRDQPHATNGRLTNYRCPANDPAGDLARGAPAVR